MARDNGEAGAAGQPARRAFPKGFGERFGLRSVADFIESFVGLMTAFESRFEWAPNQLFNNDLRRLSNSSNRVSPLIISPLMKKVGVELTFSTSAANF